MKRTIAILLTFILALSTIACGSEKAETVGLANPITEMSAQELLEQTGISFNIPESAENVKYYTIATDPITAQMIFDLEGAEITCRVLPQSFPSDEGIEDISGMYFDWETIQEGTVNNLDSTYKLNDGKEGCVCWYDFVVGLLYNVSMSTNASVSTLQEIAQICCPLAQGDSYGDVGPINVKIGKGDNITDDILALPYDIDGDGVTETVNVIVDSMDEYGCGNHTFYISTATGSEFSCDTDIWSKPEMFMADIDDDNITEIFLVGDVASDDYITYCWKFDGSQLKSIFTNDSREYIDGALTDISDENIITIESFTYILGTYGSKYHYQMVDESLVPVDGDIYKFYEDETGGKWLTSNVELIGYNTDNVNEPISVPSGTELYFTGTNRINEIYFKTKDGIIGAFPIEYNQETYGYKICGINENDAFDNLPYAG